MLRVHPAGLLAMACSALLIGLSGLSAASDDTEGTKSMASATPKTLRICRNPLHGHARTLTRRGRSGQKFRAIFEMHGVVMIPAPAPDKAVTLERRHNLFWHVVSVGCAFFSMPIPQPVIGIIEVKIDRRAMGMHRGLALIGNAAAGIGAGNRIGGAANVWRERVNLGGDFTQRIGGAVPFGEFDGDVGAFGKPDERHEILLDLALAAIAIEMLSLIHI